MNNSLKQFGNLLCSFIQRTFIPLLEVKTKQNLNAIDQWSGLRALIKDSDQIDMWKIQNYVNDIVGGENKNQHRHLVAEIKDKISNTSINRTYSAYGEQQSWNIPHSHEQLSIQQNHELPSNKYTQNKSPVHISSKLSTVVEGNPQVPKIEPEKQESFDNLLTSFRRLCTNFQSNHRKLIRDKDLFLL